MTARKAYEALMRVSLLEPTSPRFQEFAETVKRNALQDYNYTFPTGEEVSKVRRHRTPEDPQALTALVLLVR